jgi:hypothetical protein
MGGSPFCTHRLDMRDMQRCVFTLTMPVKFIFWAIILLGLVTLGGSALFLALIAKDNQGLLDHSMLIMIIVGTGMTLLGYVLLKYISRPRVFDKVSGWYWRGNDIQQQPNKPRGKDITALHDIHALQIISEYVISGKTSYHSYELNLVLKSGERINVTDHGNLRALELDARALAAFLNVPVWRNF